MNSTIYRNTVILACLRVINPALSMALIAFISRVRGPEFLGSYSLIVTLSSVFTSIGVMGLGTLITREAARTREKASSYLSSSLLLGTLSSIVMGGLLIALVPLLRYPPELSLCLRLMAVFILFSILTGFFESFFMAFEKMALIFIEQVASNVMRLLLSLVVILSGYGLVHFFLVILGSSFFAFLLCVYLYRRHIGVIELRIDFSSLRFLLANSPSFFFATLFGVVLAMRLDIVFLSKLSDLVQVALYTAAFKLFDLTMILPQAYMSSFFPRLSQLFKSNSALFKSMMQRVYYQSLLYVLVVSGLVFALADIAVRIAFGTQFSASASLLRIILLGLIPWSIAKVYGQILIAAGMQRLDLYSTILVTILNIGLNITLIRIYGAQGAAITFVCSMLLFAILQYGFVRRSVYHVSAAGLADERAGV